MINRITQRFAELKEQNRTGLITFTMAYDPDQTTSTNILLELPNSGADIIELGMPFSDPMADGPAIQAAGSRALKASATLSGIIDMVKTFRQQDNTTPIILMGYYNPIQHYGTKKFIKDTHQAGVDGFIIVDLPPEEDTDLFEQTQQTNQSLIKLITPTTDETRLKTILRKASGFLYYISVAGVTGTKSADIKNIEQNLSLFKQHTDLPIAVGFGIKTTEQAQAIGKLSEAIVVGSAFIEEITNALDDKQKAANNVLAKVCELSGALTGGTPNAQQSQKRSSQ